MKKMTKKNMAKHNKAQSTIEYCVMFAVVVAVLIVAINGPVRVALNASVQDTIDTVNESIQGIIE